MDAQKFLFGYDEGLPLELAGEGGLNARDGATHRISYLSSGPLRVPAVVSRPRGEERGAILIQHGGGESKDDPLVRFLMRRWSVAGFACLAIDAPGHGERSVSESPVVRRGFFEYLRSRIQNVIDLRRALDVLRAAGLGERPSGYWGVSMGGSVGVMLMASDDRIRAACLCLAGARSRRAWPDVDPGAAEFAARHIDPLILASEVKTASVLMLNGTDDHTVPREDAERLFLALACAREQRWFKTGHRVTPAMLRVSGEFLSEKLGARREGA